MFTFCVVLIILACIVLAFVVLIQNSKGGGLASNFASSNQIMGVRKTTDVLEKTTWGLAAFIMVLCFVCAFMSKNEVNSLRSNPAQTEQTQSADADAEE
ncbi:MAG: preprotein translocase subunit SecG [Bacteroidales bacterium]|jgi:preprotein translocase subunit SecG|nr:preprotein translocase subunit SecG [Bacteroidales bacterium]MBO7646626.1 preprotein translocase subunit SecG [Bacteroidales bacterium]MBQ4442395.1 preprotein translocase subunit SecG [Bacteroidales bacterium]MBR6131272.1 preprotein translocase subunit SecG [Bacteroidales bacterium]MCR4858360.1 preprotein translocase subunit SecG [Bacteroidales bacterium]